jgi:pentose-5-phosphate-3-epimerase
MIENPSKYFEEFKKYGADGLTIQEVSSKES